MRSGSSNFHGAFCLHELGRTQVLYQTRRLDQVNEAFKEVEDSLAQIRFWTEQAGAQADALSSARRATELTQARYDAGVITEFELVAAQRDELPSGCDDLLCHDRGGDLLHTGWQSAHHRFGTLHRRAAL